MILNSPHLCTRLAAGTRKLYQTKRTFSSTIATRPLHKPLHQRSPAYRSVVKNVDPETYWFSRYRIDHDTEIARHQLTSLLHAIQNRSPNKIVEVLQALLEAGQSHLISDKHLILLVRALRPENYFKTSPDHDAQTLYGRRMAFLRRWISKTHLSMSLETYFLLLEEARLDSAKHNSSQMASKAWADMLEKQIEPDVHCYNSYIAATCVQPAKLDNVRLRKRNDSESRKKEREFWRKRSEIVLEKTTGLYREMLRKGVRPNSLTIELLGLALGWSANLDGLNSLLLQTWNISIPEPNFDALEDQGIPDEYEDEGITLRSTSEADVNVANIPDDSDLFPTTKTLETIALCLGINQQNNLAVHAVETLAKAYQLTIPTRVWTILMKWSSLDNALSGGYTPRGHVMQIFERAQALGTRPSIGMFNIAIRDSLLSDAAPEAAYRLVDGMLSSVEGRPDGSISTFKLNEREAHARYVAVKWLLRIRKNLLATIRQIERKLEIAEANGGPDEIRLRKQDLTRRTQHLDRTIKSWTDRLRSFDARISKIRSEQGRLVDLQNPTSATYIEKSV